MSTLIDNDEKLIAKLNAETSKISWQELERFYASGAVIGVAQNLDLIEVARQFSRDNKVAVEAWLAAGTVYKLESHHALQLSEAMTMHWAVVVAPWVLIQEVEDK